MFTLSGEFINGEFADGSATNLEDATQELASLGIHIGNAMHNLKASGHLIQHYTVTVKGVFDAGTENLMTHYLEIF